MFPVSVIITRHISPESTHCDHVVVLASVMSALQEEGAVIQEQTESGAQFDGPLKGEVFRMHLPFEFMASLRQGVIKYSGDSTVVIGLSYSDVIATYVAYGTAATAFAVFVFEMPIFALLGPLAAVLGMCMECFFCTQFILTVVERVFRSHGYRISR
jgi:hypothetical protein